MAKFLPSLKLLVSNRVIGCPWSAYSPDIYPVITRNLYLCLMKMVSLRPEMDTD